MINYYKKAWKNWSDFKGRATRSEYWYFVLANIIVSIVASIILGLLVSKDVQNSIMSLYNLTTLIVGLSVGARRLHGTNRSAWWLLINLIPFVGWIVFIVFAAQDSQPGDNIYGPNPKVAQLQV